MTVAPSGHKLAAFQVDRRPCVRDPFFLERFLPPQDAVMVQVLRELKAGRKSAHWMWFVFPQLARLGAGQTAIYFGLAGLGEARAYLIHPLLGERLRQCCRLLIGQARSLSATDIVGHFDSGRLHGCLTLFHLAAPDEEIFLQCLDRFFGGTLDSATERHCEVDPSLSIGG
jgi:uncharacterized protein (DUF1810 family)